MNNKNYEEAISVAAGLFPDYDEWNNNPEYLRGMCELIADIFPVALDEDLETAADVVRADIEDYLKKEAGA